MASTEFSHNEESDSSAGRGDINKIISLYNIGSGSRSGNSQRTQVNFKSGESYKSMLRTVPSGLYETMAGADLSNLLMPFQTKYLNKVMPTLPSGLMNFSTSGFLTGKNQLPFRHSIDPTDQTSVYDMCLATSGDSLRGIISSDQYYADTDRYRDIYDQRTIGIRLPMMGVGWGFSTAGRAIPSGTRFDTFKGEYVNGYQVSPNDYIAAPIDLRYDTYRNVWTNKSGFWAEIIGSQSGTLPGVGTPSGTAYTWIERIPQGTERFTTKPFAESGALSFQPAYEVNRQSTVPSGSIVWMQRERNDSYHFTYGNASTGSSTFYGEILTSTADGSVTPVKRWTYTFRNLTKQGIGYGTWKPATSNVISGILYNFIEDQNRVGLGNTLISSGIYGNGVNFKNLTGTGLNIQPIPSGLRLPIYTITTTGNVTEYWCQYENGIDGTCS